MPDNSYRSKEELLNYNLFLPTNSFAFSFPRLSPFLSDLQYKTNIIISRTWINFDLLWYCVSIFLHEIFIIVFVFSVLVSYQLFNFSRSMMEKKHKIFDPPTDNFCTEPKCCCGLICLHEGAMAIAVIELFYAIIYIIKSFQFKNDSIEESVFSYISLVNLAIIIILIYGLKKENYRLLIIYLVYWVCLWFKFFK